MAYSADKGEKLLEIQTNLKGGMGPPITYTIDGKQYVSVMGGTGKVVFPNPGGAGGRGGAAGGRGGATVVNGIPAPGPAPAGTAAAAGNVPAPPPDAGANPFGGGPSVLPKLLTFVLDGKTPLPDQKPLP